VAFWQLLTPPALLSLLSIQAAVLALVYSLAAPLLLSMLVPTTPAGQLLQKTQWRTIGFPVIVGCALFLAYQAEYMLELWLTAQTAVREAGFARPMAISLMIAFVVIPALAWVQLTPERWLAQIQQAHQVKKLEMQQRGELAIIKASILSAERKALIGWANLLPLEREEVFNTIRGLLMAAPAMCSARYCARHAAGGRAGARHHGRSADRGAAGLCRAAGECAAGHRPRSAPRHPRRDRATRAP
jgi:hypothetical protein